MPKIAGLSLMQIQLEEQEQQPIKQLSIESRHFLLNLQLGGPGSSQKKGQYCNINLFCLRLRRKKSILWSCWESIPARDSGSPQRVPMPLSSELGETPLSPGRRLKSKPASRNLPEGTWVCQAQDETNREVEHSMDLTISGGFMGFVTGTGNNPDSQGKPQCITLWAAEAFEHTLLTLYPHDKSLQVSNANISLWFRVTQYFWHAIDLISKLLLNLSALSSEVSCSHLTLAQLQTPRGQAGLCHQISNSIKQLVCLPIILCRSAIVKPKYSAEIIYILMPFNYCFIYWQWQQY